MGCIWRNCKGLENMLAAGNVSVANSMGALLYSCVANIYTLSHGN